MNQTKKIKISIIIVNYNNARYLKKSLETALNQTYENKEIIVIDDMSNDNSIEILKKYKKKIKFYVSKKKLNLAHTIKLIVTIKDLKNLMVSIFFF